MKQTPQTTQAQIVQTSATSSESYQGKIQKQRHGRQLAISMAASQGTSTPTLPKLLAAEDKAELSLISSACYIPLSWEMNTSPACEQSIPICSGTRTGENCHGLTPESYSAQRLQHAAPGHIHTTSRRFFIGPLPRGWLRSHRKAWYNSWLGLKDYSSRTVTFTAATRANNTRQFLIAPSTAATFRPSFPQPEDVDVDEDEEYEPGEDVGATVGEARVLEPVDTSQEVPGLHRTQQSGSRDGNLASASQRCAQIRAERRSQSAAALTDNTPATSSSQDDPYGRHPTQSDTLGPNQSRETSGDLSGRNGSLIAGDTSSAASLLPHGAMSPNLTISQEAAHNLRPESPRADVPQYNEVHEDSNRPDQQILSHVASRMLRFNLQDTIRNRKRRMQNRLSRSRESPAERRQNRRQVRDGEIIRAERMLVRIDTSMQGLPDGYNENESMKTATRTVKKWREYLVVCRHQDDETTPFVLQLYSTRVIPQIQKSQMKKNCSHEVPLNLRTTKVNLFSSLDKTVALWHPYQKGARILIMRTRSAAHSVEWYTFIRQALGWQRPSTLLVYVPDLGVSVFLKHPFAHLETGDLMSDEEAGEGCSRLLKTMAQEQAIAEGIIKTCMKTLEEQPEWAQILNTWSKSERMGLAWRRYDRLEWVHGANEMHMYGTIAMRHSHELELRPKQHHHTHVDIPKTARLEEPEPIEGFLVLLTSQKGRHQRFGKKFSRRMYCFTNDQYLCFTRPARANPPPPPRLPTVSGSRVPSSAQIVKQTPITYSINPFPLHDGEISWLSKGKAHAQRRDVEAYAENRRTLENLSKSEGYFDLCKATCVRTTAHADCQEENDVNGGDVEFHDEARDRCLTDHTGRQQTQCRTFELVMDNGLVVRFRAYNLETRDEWVRRLSSLITYWQARTRADINTLKAIRQRNLDALEINEAQESLVGQFAQKWEVMRAEASPELFNMCRISGCRAIRMSGHLYRRPRRRANFALCSVFLTEGQLLFFQDALRRLSGAQIPHTHHTRQSVLDLRDCYVYSGIITSSDLLYQNQTFDSNLPGRWPSPRLYPSDGWTSSDDDSATCFVIWHTTRKTVFRSPEEEDGGEDGGGEGGGGSGTVRTKWRKVASLGTTGRSIVFKTRSRAERDLWVLAIETEIDRLQQREDVRIVTNED
ncbi:hypothetical protein AJ80_02877 [Polytolypa hystricis UAMH7299]|uniref:PH domain-containing protein n=1 Tax=Polytolypa hystricis (strain UAMH7299) TaxID=1447883 RepID=A0A2B7YQ32_POLH7|nr:hypothetical protein AJ80_02877 [Polytolypa hystricis UAMH7299]